LTANGSTVLIESANIVGHHLTPTGQRAPLNADTSGLGEIILEALDLGIR